MLFSINRKENNFFSIGPFMFRRFFEKKKFFFSFFEANRNWPAAHLESLPFLEVHSCPGIWGFVFEVCKQGPVTGEREQFRRFINSNNEQWPSLINGTQPSVEEGGKRNGSNRGKRRRQRRNSTYLIPYWFTWLATDNSVTRPNRLLGAARDKTS